METLGRRLRRIVNRKVEMSRGHFDEDGAMNVAVYCSIGVIVANLSLMDELMTIQLPLATFEADVQTSSMVSITAELHECILLSKMQWPSMNHSSV